MLSNAWYSHSQWTEQIYKYYNFQLIYIIQSQIHEALNILRTKLF